MSIFYRVWDIWRTSKNVETLNFGLRVIHGHWVKGAPLDRSHTTFYQSAILCTGMALSCTVVELFDGENIVTLKYRLEVTQGLWILYQYCINFFLLPTKFLQPVNLAILTIWSLFNPLAVPAPHRLSPFLAHQPSRHWKSQIAHSEMHHPVCGINFRILSVSLASHVSTYLLIIIHLSAHLYYHHHSHHPSLLHSFTPGSINPSRLRFLLPTGLPSWKRDWTGPIMLIILFLVSHFNFRVVD